MDSVLALRPIDAAASERLANVSSNGCSYVKALSHTEPKVKLNVADVFDGSGTHCRPVRSLAM